MTRFILFCGIVFLSTWHSTGQTTETAVTQLNIDNFSTILSQSSSFWMIDFYTPYCGHCKALAPEWKKAALMLKDVIRFGAVDCSIEDNEPLYSKYEIGEFPTMLAFTPTGILIRELDVPFVASEIAREAMSSVFAVAEDRAASQNDQDHPATQPANFHWQVTVNSDAEIDELQIGGEDVHYHVSQAEGVAPGLSDVIVVGAGPAGVGVAVALQKAGVHNVVLLEKSHRVADSFLRWPAEMRLLTPSFWSNPFGAVDLNALTPDSSPAFTTNAEHPYGYQYADYVAKVAAHYELQIYYNHTVTELIPTTVTIPEREDDAGGTFSGFNVTVKWGSNGVDGQRTRMLQARYVIWAAGEFGFPDPLHFKFGVHSSLIPSWHDLAISAAASGRSKGPFIIVGGFESGIDAACELVAVDGDLHVIVIARSPTWVLDETDPSKMLAPATLHRLQQAQLTGRLTLLVDEVQSIKEGPTPGTWQVVGQEHQLETPFPPILATGFKASPVIGDLFNWKGKHSILSGVDESTVTPGLFLVGPAVWHERKKHHQKKDSTEPPQQEVVFCFIYKFRTRFGVVAQQIAQRMGMLVPGGLNEYISAGMLMEHLNPSASCNCGKKRKP
eukprot:TRINITY_DN69522_c0_g1_i1.p1 TRINITY_DN69522_c0_g1~~TRINITY_DN69522_c0_g1_i1.p1  ORF type:complete len:613 (-),score=71.54 TRINITY_DN69522_c0_g1_i1:164-2002(-)